MSARIWRPSSTTHPPPARTRFTSGAFPAKTQAVENIVAIPPFQQNVIVIQNQQVRAMVFLDRAHLQAQRPGTAGQHRAPQRPADGRIARSGGDIAAPQHHGGVLGTRYLTSQMHSNISVLCPRSPILRFIHVLLVRWPGYKLRLQRLLYNPRINSLANLNQERVRQGLFLILLSRRATRRGAAQRIMDARID